MIKKTYHISDMHCSSCAMRLEGLEDTLNGIRNIKASYRKQTLEFEFDETVLKEAEIFKAIADLGYTVQL
jgi:copper chaperone CopZ